MKIKSLRPGVALAALLLTLGAALAAEPTLLRIDPSAAGTPFPHFWEKTFGSGRAVLALRDNYRKDIRLVKSITGFQNVRAHAIFHDEIGLYETDPKGNVTYNFSYVDQIYDGLLADGVRPFVELSFMPQQLAADPKDIFGFWYKPNISPPKTYAQWDEMIEAFARHLIARYGIDELAQWDFEVWNEPNIGFWGGKPAQSTYFELYDHTALALKRVDSRLRVGGPSTAQAAWAADFIAHCKANHIPVDFISSHVYANDSSHDVFQTEEHIPRDKMVCRSVRKVHEEIKASEMPDLPLIFSEYNASFANEPNVTDTSYMGPWLASTIGQCDGLTEAMSYWSFSDVFEEGGVVKTPFYGGFGLIAEDDIPKPAFNAFAILHKLGTTRLPVESDSALLTRRDDGTLVIALWNYSAPDGIGEKYTLPPASRATKVFTLDLASVSAHARNAALWRVDEDHGNVLKSYDAMGRPPFPDRTQIQALRAAGALPAPDQLAIHDRKLQVSVPEHGLAVIEIR